MICVIPAAGKGTRWAPVSGYLPKEMLPLIDRPVTDWVINEAIDSGCKKIIVVINSRKEVIKNYILKNNKLCNKAQFEFVYQEEAFGIAHAILLCQNLIDNQPFAVALPDLPTISRIPVLKQVIQSYEKSDHNSHIVSFDTFSSETLHLYGECLLQAEKNNSLKIIHFCPSTDMADKPHHYGINTRMSGRFIFTPQIFPIIEDLMKFRTDEEISDRSALKAALESGQSVTGIEISGHTYDTGYPNGYVRANTAFFKKLLQKRVLT